MICPLLWKQHSGGQGCAAHSASESIQRSSRAFMECALLAAYSQSGADIRCPCGSTIRDLSLGYRSSAK
eukprot:3662803-Rhodomonas_salina.1